jgi:hypothetical protein
MKIGIAIDSWKQEEFEKVLKEKGYEFNTVTLSPKVKLIKVSIKPDEVKFLQKVIMKLQIDVKSSN